MVGGSTGNSSLSGFCLHTNIEWSNGCNSTLITSQILLKFVVFKNFKIKIRTYFNLADDVIVLAYPGWITMNSIEVYGSNTYFTSSQYPNDKCLCGSYVSNTDKDCRIILNDKCFNDVVVGTDTRFRAFVEKLIDDCEKDAGVNSSLF